jgi:serine/threonine protein kinase
MALSAGVRLGPYEIVAPLGSGGMGEVYRATDPRLRREVAIKILPAGLANDPERLRRFEQEALAAASLNHPNILAVYDIGVHPSMGSAEATPYIVSELLEGGTLRETLESGSVPVRKALDYAVQVANGLAAAHEKGIVHRDLKPENLFVTRDGRVKILDFGLAKLTQSESAPVAVTNLRTGVQQTEAGVIVGTVGYMSPEQVRGAAADSRSDIFSFALVLYELLSGRRPFAAPSAVETMHAILTQDTPDLVRRDGPVPPALDRVIRRCLEKNPEQRFQSARDLAFNLEALSSDSAARMTTTAAAGPPRRRSRALPAMVVGLLVVAAAAAGFLAASRTGRQASPTYTRLTYRRGTVQSARFAPDGQTIVYSAAWQGQPTGLFSTRVGSAQSRSLEIGGPGRYDF